MARMSPSSIVSARMPALPPHEKKAGDIHDMLYNLTSAARNSGNKNLPKEVRQGGKAAIDQINVMHGAMMGKKGPKDGKARS